MTALANYLMTELDRGGKTKSTGYLRRKKIIKNLVQSKAKITSTELYIPPLHAIALHAPLGNTRLVNAFFDCIAGS